MFCWNCGGKLNDGSKFCCYCGTKLFKDEAPAAQDVSAAQDVPAVEESPVTQPGAPEYVEPVAVAAPEPVAVELTEPVPVTVAEPVDIALSEPVSQDAPVVQDAPAAQDVPAVEESSVTQLAPPESMAVPKPFEEPAVQFAPEPVTQFAAPEPEVPPAAMTETIPQYTEPSVQAAEAVAPVKKKSGAKTVILSILFGIFIFIFGLVSALGESVRATLSANMLSTAVAESDMSSVVVGDILNDEKVQQMAEDFGGDFSGLDEDATIAEALDGNSIFDKKSAEKFLNNSFMTKYIGDVVKSYELYLLYNVEGDCLSGEKLSELAGENLDELSDICGAEVYIVEDEMDDYISSVSAQTEGFNPQNALGGVGEISSVVLSPVVLIAIAVIALLFAVILGATTNDVSAAILTTGICALLIGGLMLAVCEFKQKLFEFAGLTYEAVTGYASELLDASVCINLEKYGFIIVCAGAVLFIAAIIIKIAVSAARKNKKVK